MKQNTHPPRDPLWPAHHDRLTCPGCVTYPTNGHSTKATDPDGFVRWCMSSRYVASKQEIAKHRDEMRSAFENADLLQALSSYRAWPRRSGSPSGKTVRHTKEQLRVISRKNRLQKREVTNRDR